MSVKPAIRVIPKDFVRGGRNRKKEPDTRYEETVARVEHLTEE